MDETRVRFLPVSLSVPLGLCASSLRQNVTICKFSCSRSEQETEDAPRYRNTVWLQITDISTWKIDTYLLCAYILFAKLTAVLTSTFDGSVQTSRLSDDEVEHNRTEKMVWFDWCVCAPRCDQIKLKIYIYFCVLVVPFLSVKEARPREREKTLLLILCICQFRRLVWI